jgi:hypothetical protein
MARGRRSLRFGTRSRFSCWISCAVALTNPDSQVLSVNYLLLFMLTQFLRPVVRARWCGCIGLNQWWATAQSGEENESERTWAHDMPARYRKPSPRLLQLRKIDKNYVASGTMPCSLFARWRRSLCWMTEVPDSTPMSVAADCVCVHKSAWAGVVPDQLGGCMDRLMKDSRAQTQLCTQM